MKIESKKKKNETIKKKPLNEGENNKGIFNMVKINYGKRRVVAIFKKFSIKQHPTLGKLTTVTLLR